MNESVLESIKKLMGIDESYDVFDQDLIIHINSALFVAMQLGVRLQQDYTVKDPFTTWEDICEKVDDFVALKSYVYLKAKLLFDPPTVGVLHEAMERQIQEFEWRLSFEADPKNKETI